MDELKGLFKIDSITTFTYIYSLAVVTSVIECYLGTLIMMIKFDLYLYVLAVTLKPEFGRSHITDMVSSQNWTPIDDKFFLL